MREGGHDPALAPQNGGGWGRRLLGIAGRHRWWILATAGLAFLTTGSGIGLIALAAYLISRSALVSTTTDLALIITGVRAFAITRVVSRYLERYVGHLGTFRTLTRIRVWFFRGIEPLAPAVLADERRGDLLARISDDVDTLQDMSLRVAVPPLAAALTTAVAAVVLGWFNPLLAVVLVVFLVTCGVVLPLARRRLVREPAGDALRASAQVTTTVVECLDGISDLVAAGRPDLLVDRVERATDRQLAADRSLARARAVTTAAAALLTGSCAVVVLAIGTSMVRSGTMGGVTLAVLPLVAIVAFEAVQPLALAFEHLDRSKVAAQRLFDLVDREPAVLDPAEPVAAAALSARTGPAVEFHDVSFTYPGSHRPVLAGASFTVPNGARVALVGPSGSGKSTIVDLLLRFRGPTSGTIAVHGCDTATARAGDVRDQVAVVAQHDHLFDTTVRDNLLLGDGDAGDDRLWAACEAAAFDDVVRSLPRGLDERMGEDGDRLSGGERQRLMVARALLTDAPILVLDEATAHLDPATRTRMLDGVARWRPNGTTIVIAQDAAALDGVDAVLRVADGRVVVGSVDPD
jgi:thiol reductant ABC exporter CydC subunit